MILLQYKITDKKPKILILSDKNEITKNYLSTEITVNNYNLIIYFKYHENRAWENISVISKNTLEIITGDIYITFKTKIHFISDYRNFISNEFLLCKKHKILVGDKKCA